MVSDTDSNSDSDPEDEDDDEKPEELREAETGPREREAGQARKEGEPFTALSGECRDTFKCDDSGAQEEKRKSSEQEATGAPDVVAMAAGTWRVKSECMVMWGSGEEELDGVGIR